VLFLEFLPVVFEKFGFKKPLRWIHAISVPLMIAGVLLSTLHQSSLGTLYLIAPSKLDALWYTPIMPVLFYVSAICAGLAMTIFESWHSSRAFGRALELPLLSSIGRVLAVGMTFYLWIRMLDIHRRHASGLLWTNRTETWLFWLEIALAAVPALLLFKSSVRTRPAALYACAVSIVFSFVANRMNVAITGMERSAGVSYIPKWSELAITLSIVAIGFAVFRFVGQYFPIFEAEEHEDVCRQLDAEREMANAGRW
jgi:Ni/Fe-hydrogenase subunit HybB-like protein